MARLPPDTAIFSPSFARQAASAAKDWSHVDAWLASKYNGRSPPSFERNPDTLKALLALASLNEVADENRTLLVRAKADALSNIKTLEEVHTSGRDPTTIPSVLSFSRGLLTAVEHSLTEDGKASLDAMASSAVHLGMAFAEPAQLGQAMLDLQVRNFDLDQALARVAVLQRYIDAESARLDNLLHQANGDTYRPPAHLSRQNLDMQRKVKVMASKLPELNDRVSALAGAVGTPSPTIDQLRQEEQSYLALLDVKKTLDQHLGDFEGLPPDTQQARQHLESLRKELRAITDHRDAVFENLVERETPRKGR
ncbi:hypothetical protein BD289DRAFT_368537 [Coniella lustricola]|uniref:HAUS augmin-like complex subunit 1 n=1 Tax=Coniella lustricola TaxID=2025994 RepID=A0A2T3A7Y3_9PEZI|nr:hypothetical protein BD289DRAFT_368537 [Coniella lustricola]